jgi:hypothetical protein
MRSARAQDGASAIFASISFASTCRGSPGGLATREPLRDVHDRARPPPQTPGHQGDTATSVRDTHSPAATADGGLHSGALDSWRGICFGRHAATADDRDDHALGEHAAGSVRGCWPPSPQLLHRCDTLRSAFTRFLTRRSDLNQSYERGRGPLRMAFEPADATILRERGIGVPPRCVSRKDPGGRSRCRPGDASATRVRPSRPRCARWSAADIDDDPRSRLPPLRQRLSTRASESR